ncbi:hypothetical protein BJ742DRAFT_789122 [Cladochytrium replicatum]|nr:hypothetical protein BJ742DRAFT_789122 [Cladochytrium replicatum]
MGASVGDIVRSVLGVSLAGYDKIDFLLQYLLTLLVVLFLPRILSGYRPTLRPTSSTFVLVTGASSGIGRAAAIALAKKGYQVLATVRKADDARMIEEMNENIRSLFLDLGDEASLEACAKKVKEILNEEQGELVGVVNNAGVISVHLLESESMETVHRTFQVNLFGPIRLIQLLLPMLPASSRVVFVGSGLGKMTTPGAGVYCMSKAALRTLTDSLRRELRGKKINVSRVEPGFIRTRMVGDMLDSAQPNEGDDDDTTKERLRKIRQMISIFSAFGATTDATDRAILHAFTSPFPRTCYVVGWEWKILNFVFWILPSRLQDALVAAIFRQ